jgi:hypothetical protein
MYRRIYDRYETNASAILAFSGNTEEKFMLQNISARGVSVVGYHPLQINDKVTIAFQMPPIFNKPILKEAKIVWCKEVNDVLWEAGLDFGLDNRITLPLD